MDRKHSSLTTKYISPFNLKQIFRVVSIWRNCGKDMATKYGIHHWDNGWIKSFMIFVIQLLKGFKTYVVCDNADTLATFQIRQSYHQLNFSKFAVNPKLNGKGIGSYCIEVMSRMALESQCNILTCEVYDKSRHALEFYLHRGFCISGEIHTIKYTEIVLTKSLTI